MAVYLSRNAQALLDFLRHTSPNMQAKYYFSDTLGVPETLIRGDNKEILLEEAYERLCNAGALKKEGVHIYRMTDEGRNWRFYHWMSVRENLWKSVFVPILVSFLTALATSAAGKLLLLLLPM